jgi:hypothetical protein
VETLEVTFIHHSLSLPPPPSFPLSLSLPPLPPTISHLSLSHTSIPPHYISTPSSQSLSTTSLYLPLPPCHTLKHSLSQI